MKPLYTLDASFFINGWTKYYKYSVFPGVWALVENYIADGRVISCFDVYEELKGKDDPLQEWAKTNKQYFQEPTEECAKKMREVMKAFPNLVAKGKAQNKADPWVVALAIVTDTTVVTDEQPQDSCSETKPPKLPFVCDHFEVAWMRPWDFLEQIGHVFH